MLGMNMQSPIVQGMYNNTYNPIGAVNNIVSLNQGYNMGGYYNNQYNNYFNPYLFKRQQEMQRIQQEQEQQKQVDLMKMISTNANKALGYDVDEDYLKRYEPPEMRQDPEEAITYQLLNINQTGYTYDPRLLIKIDYHNKLYNDAKQRFPDDMSLNDYLDKAGELYRESEEQERREKQQDLSKLYNSQQYQQLLKQHKGSTFFNSLFNGVHDNNKNTDISDLEIGLPERIKSEYASRRAAFLANITNNR